MRTLCHEEMLQGETGHLVQAELNCSALECYDIRLWTVMLISLCLSEYATVLDPAGRAKQQLMH